MSEPDPHRHWVLPCPECTGTGLTIRGGTSRGVGFTVAYQCPVCEGSRFVRVPSR
jgi:predicted RNA-binding Zn-ribbon protein involved in translation (DUF1610 family)